MVSYSTSDFKPGLKILIDGEPCEIIGEEFVKPGKGQAFSKVKFKNLLTQRTSEKTCKVGESIESADVNEVEMQYLYSEGTDRCFMNQESYDQVLISENLIGDNKNWLTEEDICQVLLWNDTPISIIPPNFVDLKITQTDPGVKGDTASGGNKPATLATGAVIKVPLFVSEGDIVTVDTRNGEYQGRK